ncbi:hypothetical protein EV130_104330 [Rhizobium azibense]|uniref:Uncharacterized protein n=1 Tax=Rhizobium azibense TaxID=1136135 RepID=A0A4R3QW90_9HYPH|nr:hypothetical protein EV130_104330 [Rhizobium azibense]
MPPQYSPGLLAGTSTNNQTPHVFYPRCLHFRSEFAEVLFKILAISNSITTPPLTHIDHHLSTGEGFREPFAGEGVDASAGRGGDHFVTRFAQESDGARPNQSAAADNDDF